MLVGKPEERTLRRPRIRQQYNIEMDIREIVLEVDWIYLDKVRDRWRGSVNTMKL
jgi:hypothetical protein